METSRGERDSCHRRGHCLLALQCSRSQQQGCGLASVLSIVLKLRLCSSSTGLQNRQPCQLLSVFLSLSGLVTYPSCPLEALQQQPGGRGSVGDWGCRGVGVQAALPASAGEVPLFPPPQCQRMDGVVQNKKGSLRKSGLKITGALMSSFLCKLPFFVFPNCSQVNIYPQR